MMFLDILTRSLVTSTRFALVAFLCWGFATTTTLCAANTSASAQAGACTAAPQSVVVQTAPSAPAVLSQGDAELYRRIFAAQRREAWAEADAAIAQLSDRRLMGSVLADRYQRRRPSAAERKAWLASYGDLPEAAIIAAAKHSKKDNTPDSAPDFGFELSAEGRGSATTALARGINRALRRGDPEAARNLLLKAEPPPAGSFAADANAVIAAGFFYDGEREQAKALATAAAGAKQPLGLWIRGLIAWEDQDLAIASAHFQTLAEHPALNAASRAAAHFWAYRALSRSGDKKAGWRQLEQASQAKTSFYGLLATQLLGRNHTMTAQAEPHPVWSVRQSALLEGQTEGSRALALLQIGETGRAELALRRLYVKGGPELRGAILALADFVPLPELALHPAENAGPDVQAALYPLPPWRPQHGFRVDRALLYALARQESRLDPLAISPRGACGLMQVMPATARHMAGDEVSEEDITASGKLFDPAYNMAMGQAYIRHLAGQPAIGDNLMLLLAAYNGGPNNVARWKQDNATRDPLLFMESIPLRETRAYIARVLPHYWAYRARLGEPLASLRQLAEGQWPRFDANSSGSAVRVASNRE